MIKIENVQVVGWEAAIRGMRNPKNSWDRSDSTKRNAVLVSKEIAPGIDSLVEEACEPYVDIGLNDYKLMTSLAKGGPVHAKYRRFIDVYLDILAPLYWWKEFDTYKVGTVANSCSTMHKIAAKEFVLEDFSCEHLIGRHDDGLIYPESPLGMLRKAIGMLNHYRDIYLNGGYVVSGSVYHEPKDKDIWWQLIQLLPSSYNQRRTVKLNYEVLVNMYESRKDHKLDEWRIFCKWIEDLPYSGLITGKSVLPDEI
jgi:hypothetical protein